MMIKIQKILFCLSVLSVSACSIAKKSEIEDNYKIYESKEIQCGQEQIKVVSYCFDPEEGLVDRGSGGIVRECKSSQLFIGRKKIINLPILKQEINKFYSSRILKEGNLSLVSFSCAQNDKEAYMILNQGVTNNANSLDNSEKKRFDTPVILSIKGVPVSENNKILKNKKYKKSRAVSANSVYGVN